MAISLILLFIVCLISSFFENRMDQRQKLFLYIFIGIGMIFIAGLREVGSTPDTEAYEDMYNGTYSAILEDITEPSFTLISDILNFFALDINALFFTYAILSVTIFLSAFWKMSKQPMMTLAIFFSFYYMLYSLVQIRAGVAAGLFVWAMYFYYNNKKWYSLGFIVAAILFHYSAATCFIIFLFSNKLYKWEKYFMYAIIPIGIVAYYTDFDISYLVPDSIGGAKLEAYRQLKDMGVEEDQAGYPLKYNIGIWMNILVYLISLYYSDYLSHKAKYLIIALKVQAFGFFCLFFLNGVSMVLAGRLNGFYSISSVLIWTSFVYLFYPRYIGNVINASFTTLRFVTSFLFFALSYYFMHM